MPVSATLLYRVVALTGYSLTIADFSSGTNGGTNCFGVINNAVFPVFYGGSERELVPNAILALTPKVQQWAIINGGTKGGTNFCHPSVRGILGRWKRHRD